MKQSRRHVAMTAMVLALTLAAQGCSRGTQTAQQSPTIRYEKYSLANGLEVILSEDHRLPLVAVDLWYHVGPANEKAGRTGFAHLFEHMMFQGSKHAGDQPFQLLEAAGATEINGTTDFDRTNYFETMPANQLELALWLESDRMGWLLDKLDERKLITQRDVVRNERRQAENSPYYLVEEEVFHQLFPENHPYHGDVIGSHADIESANLDDVRDFFRQYYAPNNASLAIVGDYDPRTVKALVEKYFGPLPAGPPISKVDAVTPPITQEKRVTVTDQVQLPRLYMAWITAPFYQPGDAEADLLARILGGGRSSRLYKKLVYEKQIAQDVSVFQYSLTLGSVFQIEATAKPGIELPELEEAVDAELSAVQEKGPDADEMERARNSIETTIIQGLQSLGGFGGVADTLNQYNHYLKDPGYLPKDLARYRNATPEAVRQMADTLTKDSRVVVYGIPGEKVIHEVPKRPEPKLIVQNLSPESGDTEWRKTPPPPGKARDMVLPVPAEFKLANGLTVLLVEQHNLPVFTANLAVLRGSDSNPVDKPGLASFTASMLTEGTQSRSAPQLADDIARIGATLNAGSSMDASFVSGMALKRNADALFQLLSDVVQNPAFREEEVERVRQLRLTSLLQQADNPNTLAARIFYREVYGQKSPYGFLDTGTREATEATSREDMLNFYRSGYGPQNAALIVAGDITQAELKKLAEAHLGGWAGQAQASSPPPAAAETKRRIVIVDKPGAPQSVLRIGRVGLARNHPDYVPVTIMNEILGGLFSSRINLNLREAHGYTYGAYSVFSFRRGPGPFFVTTMVRTDATAPSVKEIFGELDRMRNSRVKPEELNMARETDVRALTGIFETTQQTASTLANLYVYGLPLDYYRTLPQKIMAVDAAEVQRVAQSYLLPESMVVVAVGDRSGIEKDLNGLGLGAMQVLDAEGNPAGAGASRPKR
jgi:zinc protease